MLSPRRRHEKREPMLQPPTEQEFYGEGETTPTKCTSTPSITHAIRICKYDARLRRVILQRRATGEKGRRRRINSDTGYYFGCTTLAGAAVSPWHHFQQRISGGFRGTGGVASTGLPTMIGAMAVSSACAEINGHILRTPSGEYLDRCGDYEV